MVTIRVFLVVIAHTSLLPRISHMLEVSLTCMINNPHSNNVTLLVALHKVLLVLDEMSAAKRYREGDHEIEGSRIRNVGENGHMNVALESIFFRSRLLVFSYQFGTRLCLDLVYDTVKS